MLVLTPGVSWYFVLQSNPIFAACEGVGTRSLLVSKKAGHGASRSSVAKHAPSTVEVEKSFYDSPSSDSPVGFLVLTRGDPLGRTSTVLLCILGPGQLHNSPLPLSTGTKRLQTGQHSPELAPTICKLKPVRERWRERAKGAG